MLSTTPRKPRLKLVPLPTLPVLPPSHNFVGGLPSPTTPFPGAAIHLHDLLCPSPTRFYYDLRTPPSSIIFRPSYTPCALSIPAMIPPQDTMRIVVPTDPHRPVIIRSSAPGGITVGDVLESLYQFLRTPLTDSIGDGPDGPYIAQGDGSVNIGLGLSHRRSAGWKSPSRASQPPENFHSHAADEHEIETLLPIRIRSHDVHADVGWDMGAARKSGQLGKRTVFAGLEVGEEGCWVLRTSEVQESAKEYNEGQGAGNAQVGGQEDWEQEGEEERRRGEEDGPDPHWYGS